MNQEQQKQPEKKETDIWKKKAEELTEEENQEMIDILTNLGRK